MYNLRFEFLRRRIRPYLPDRVRVRYQFHHLVGEWPDLRNPRTFNEKICWLKLYGMTPLHSFCADKATAPLYVESRIGPGHTAQRYLAFDSADALRPEAIPYDSYVIKTTHDSGGVFVVADPAKANWEQIRTETAARLRRSHYPAVRERQYKTIRPAIVVEELLAAPDGSPPDDFKVYCFNGAPRLIRHIRFEPEGGQLKKKAAYYFDLDWNELPVHREGDPTEVPPAERPEHLEEMLRQATLLAEPFVFVRVDFLSLPNRLVAGELTFAPFGGTRTFDPRKYDLELGGALDHKQPCNWRKYLPPATALQGPMPAKGKIRKAVSAT